MLLRFEVHNDFTDETLSGSPSGYRERFSVFRQFHVGAETGEAFRLKSVDRDHCLRMNLSDKLDDVIGVDMTARVNFDQIAIHFVELCICLLPFLLFQVSGPTGVKAPAGFR